MIINENIVGIFSKSKLLYLAELASQVPENGWIIEMGAHSGRATYALGMNKKESVKLTAIDRFMPQVRKPRWRGPVDIPVAVFEHWEENTKDVKNLDHLSATLPFNAEFIQPTRQCDLLVIDLNHTYEGTLRLLNDWHPLLTNGGVCAVAAYHSRNGVKEALHEFTELHSLELITHKSGLVSYVKI